MATVRENTIVVKGYLELIRAFALTDVEINAGLRQKMKSVGEAVRADAAARLISYNSHLGRSAAGYRVIVSQTGVSVRQSIGRTSDESRRRPDFGALQMRHALLPALDAQSQVVEASFISFLDFVVGRNF